MSSPTLSGDEYLAITRRQQQAWAAGDFGVIGLRVMAVSEALVESAGLRAGQRVLDVACGSGNAALIAARRFCDVSGIDYVPSLVERARRRAKADGLRAAFEVADAQALPFPDASFDAVLSAFGVMFAPDQELAARELVRVCKPGGTIALASWMPDEYGGELLGTYAKYAGAVPGLQAPVRWGDQRGIQELLGEHVEWLRPERRTVYQYYPSLQAALQLFFEFFGPMRAAYEALPKPRRLDFEQELGELFRRYNRAPDETLMLECEYLQVLAKRS